MWFFFCINCSINVTRTLKKTPKTHQLIPNSNTPPPHKKKLKEKPNRLHWKISFWKQIYQNFSIFYVVVLYHIHILEGAPPPVPEQILRPQSTTPIQEVHFPGITTKGCFSTLPKQYGERHSWQNYRYPTKKTITWRNW